MCALDPVGRFLWQKGKKAIMGKIVKDPTRTFSFFVLCLGAELCRAGRKNRTYLNAVHKEIACMAAANDVSHTSSHHSA
jgi:hypothetical protein